MADIPAPGKPGTYLPIPGQSSQSNDAANDAKIAKQNSSSIQPAQPFNGGVIPTDGSGNVYVKDGTPKLADTIANAIVSEIPTQVGAQGPKGDKGDRGPKGEPGDPGPQGPAGTVDYDTLRDMIEEIVNDLLNVKQLKFVEPTPTQVYGTKSVTFAVELFDPLTNTSNVVTPVYTLGRDDLGSIATDGTFTSVDVTEDGSVTIVASYTDQNNKNYTASTDLLVKALVVQSLTVGGPTSINSAGSGTYTATAHYTDGSTKAVTSDPATTWSVTTADIGTMNANVLQAPIVTTNKSGSVRASYTEKGIEVQGTRNVSIVAPAQKALYGVAPLPVTGGAYYTYDDWSDWIQANLLQQGTGSGKANTITTNQGADEYGWYAYPMSYGTATFVDTSNNFPGGWDGAKRAFPFDEDNGPLTVDVDINGSTVSYYLYRTTNAAIGQKTWAIS